MQVIPEKHESTQTTILALLLSQKGGYTLSQLCKEYYEVEGENIPWKKLGYTSLMNFIQSMSKSIKIESNQNTVILKGIASNKSKHVSKLVAGQKDEKAPIRRTMYKSSYYSKTLPSNLYIPSEILSMIINIVNKHPNGVHKDFVLQKIQNCMPYTNITMSDMEERLHLLSHKISATSNRLYPVQSSSQNISSKMAIMIAGEEEQLDSSSDHVDENKFTLLHSTSVSTERNNNVEKYTISNNYNSIEKESCFTYKHGRDLINSRVKFRLEKLIQNNPNGIWCAELPEKYLEEYRVNLNYKELGFSSIREFVSHLPEIFHCVQIDNTGDFILYYSKRQISLINSKEKQKTTNLAELHKVYISDGEVEALPTTLTIDTCNQLIPEDIVTIGECVDEIHVADLVRDGTPHIEVVVVEVFTPSFFWIQLRKKLKAFKTFMDELNNFYVSKHENYIIPPAILEKGLNCACIYNGVWHRGIIKTVKPDLHVTVMFYDYGTLKTYKPTEVYYLHKTFSVLPAQAIPCGLYNTRPYKAIKWSQYTTHKFAAKISDKPFVATIASINEMDNSMTITLTDTIGDEDIHINDWLVEQKLAEFGKMVCLKARNFPFRYYLKCQKHKTQKSEKPETFQSSEVIEPTKCVGKSSHRLKCLYEKVMKFKLNFNKEKSILNNESLSNNINKNEYDGASPVQFTKEKKICHILNEQDDILRNYSNLPKLYAHGFDIRNSDEESIEMNPGDHTGMCNEQREIKYMDWSISQENMEQEKCITKRKIPEKIYKCISEKRDNIPLPETYFLRIVQNSVHFAERDEDICWLPDGNINKVEDPSPLVLRTIQKRAYRDTAEKTIAIPQSILNLLIKKDSPAEIAKSSKIVSKSINEATSVTSIQENDSIVNDDSTHSEKENNENIKMKSDSNNISQISSNISYVCMKPRTIKRELIEVLMTKLRERSHSSILDSDDFSEENSCNSDSVFSTDNVSHSVETENIDLDVPKSRVNRHIGNNEFSEKFDSSVSSTSSESVGRNESFNESEFTEKSKSTESSGLAEKILVRSSQESTLQVVKLVENNSDKISTELIPVNQSSALDLSTTVSAIPILNDADIGSDEAEWDVQMGLSDLHHSFKIDSPLIENVGKTLEYNTTHATIKEIDNSDSIEDTNGIDMEYSSIDKREYSNESFEKLLNQNGKSTSTSPESVSRNESFNESEFTEKSKSTESSGLAEKILVRSSQESTLQVVKLVENNSDKISTELIPVNQSSALDPSTTASAIPILNDADLGSDEEEWDVHVRLSDLHHSSKIDSPLIKNVGKTLEYNTTHATIEEIDNSDSIEDTNGIDMEYSSIDNREYSNKSFENLLNQNGKSTATSPASVSINESQESTLQVAKRN
ncbi:uncharacterized protein LOC144473122 [Augochlora pura]